MVQSDNRTRRRRSPLHSSRRQVRPRSEKTAEESRLTCARRVCVRASGRGSYIDWTGQSAMFRGGWSPESLQRSNARVLEERSTVPLLHPIQRPALVPDCVGQSLANRLLHRLSWLYSGLRCSIAASNPWPEQRERVLGWSGGSENILQTGHCGQHFSGRKHSMGSSLNHKAIGCLSDGSRYRP